MVLLVESKLNWNWSGPCPEKNNLAYVLGIPY